MHARKLALALALAAAFGAQAASAADLALTADGQWHAFDVDDIAAASGGLEWIDLDGSALSFSFSGPATLMVVDGGFAGDRFEVYDNGVLLGATSAAVDSYPASVGMDFEVAIGDAGYSRGVYLLGGGNHTITGMLSTSALDDLGMPLNATVGAVQLLAAPVPEPETYALMLAGLGLIGLAARRRAN
ncbi:MAG: PEP-CTERM sorting domain-containing protein [Pseudomonadota bacterium]